MKADTATMRTVLTIGALLALSVHVVSPTFAQSESRTSLRALRQLYVSVELLDPSNGCGVDAAAIQTDVELKLRTAGVRVIQKDEQSLKSAVLKVRLAFLLVARPPPGSYAFAIGVSVGQQVYLARDRSISAPSVTFSVDHVGYVEQPQVAAYVRQGVRDEVDAFLNEYLAANPKTAP